MKKKTIKKPFVSRKRHIAKAISWRVVGTIDTWLISWFLLTYLGEFSLINVEITDDISLKSAEAATYIATLELITKTGLYYFHERVWYSLSWIIHNQKARHIIKTISWRFFGAIDTILLVFIVFYFLFSTTQGASEIALSMFSIEIITKMILYYIHERIWFMSNYGVEKAPEIK